MPAEVESLRKSLKIYKGLVEVSGLINSITDYNELLRAILDVARRVVLAGGRFSFFERGDRVAGVGDHLVGRGRVQRDPHLGAPRARNSRLGGGSRSKPANSQCLCGRAVLQGGRSANRVSGFIRKSPIIDMSSALSAIAISEPQHGRFHQLEASSKICSCISVTPIAPTGDGAKHGSDKSQMYADRGFAMFAPAFLSSFVAPYGTGGSSARPR